MKDVVIVGGGLAGLSAGWRLRHCDVLLLEAEGRVGGRIRSERRGPYWLNWGGHVFAGPDSATGWLLGNTGIDSVPVPGSLAGLSMNGKLLLKGRVESYPFRIPMSRSSRIATLRTGAKVGRAVARYARIVKVRPGEDAATRQQRIYDFMNERSFSDFVGDLPEDAEALLKPTVTRSSASSTRSRPEPAWATSASYGTSVAACRRASWAGRRPSPRASPRPCRIGCT